MTKKIRACRVCGCTDDRACPGGCSWEEYDLCTSCEGAGPAWTDGPVTLLAPGAQRIAGLLGARGLREGRYGAENLDAWQWLAEESNDVLAAIIEGRDPGEVLIDTGYWGDGEGPFPADFRRQLIAAAL